MLKPAIVCKHKQTRHQANSTLPHAWTGRGGLAQTAGAILALPQGLKRMLTVRPQPRFVESLGYYSGSDAFLF
jgi:hypothetical protein